MTQRDGARLASLAEFTAMYRTICRIVEAEHLPVDVHEPGVSTPITDDIMAMIASFPPAYTVELVINPRMVCVARTGRYGIGGAYAYVDYPAALPAEDFQARLATVLVPVIRRELRLAAGEQRWDFAQDGPPSTCEAVVAVRPVDYPDGGAGRGGGL